MVEIEFCHLIWKNINFLPKFRDLLKSFSKLKLHDEKSLHYRPPKHFAQLFCFMLTSSQFRGGQNVEWLFVESQIWSLRRNSLLKWSLRRNSPLKWSLRRNSLLKWSLCWNSNLITSSKNYLWRIPTFDDLYGFDKLKIDYSRSSLWF